MKCKIQSWRKKDKMWSMIITVKKGELLMLDHKRADQVDFDILSGKDAVSFPF